MAVDWEAMRTDYITGDKSYRELARKYGVHHSTVYRKVNRDGWQEERATYRAKALTKQAEAQGAAMARGVEQCVRAAEKLLERLLERVEKDPEPILPQEYRHLTGAIKDIRDILTSGVDIERKRAEIEKLRHDMGEGKDTEIRVVIDGGGAYDG